jgi:hypothetical protein
MRQVGADAGLRAASQVALEAATGQRSLPEALQRILWSAPAADATLGSSTAALWELQASRGADEGAGCRCALRAHRRDLNLHWKAQHPEQYSRLSAHPSSHLTVCPDRPTDHATY